ncbi:MAG TPA: TetR family transcriptional regulator [Candidatus Aminicenantes bacterium]|nr:TetR family transcriptional regulator [Candidatus Aminicenantes bacterium]
MKKDKNPGREKILKAAQNEFAARGFAGARMEAIARSAGCNKAMLFYYFSSKEGLYQTILKEVMGEFFTKINGVLTPDLTPAALMEKFPELYIQLFARHPEFVRIVAFDLIHDPDNLCGIMGGIISQMTHFGPHPLFERIRRWHEQGLTSEPDPLHFMMNIVALSIFSFIGKPMVEAISGIRVASDEEFYRRRVASVVNVLKRGMLK